MLGVVCGIILFIMCAVKGRNSDKQIEEAKKKFYEDKEKYGFM